MVSEIWLGTQASARSGGRKPIPKRKLGMLNSVGGSKEYRIFTFFGEVYTKNGVALPKEFGWIETDEVGKKKGGPVFRTVGKDGKVLPEDHPFAWRMEYWYGLSWGMFWQKQTTYSYYKDNGDPTNPLTIKDGQGWLTSLDCGKKPPPRFEEVFTKEQVRTPYH